MRSPDAGSIFSEFVIYNSGSSRQKAEFRDVQAVNGHMFTEHEQRLFTLLREVISGDPDVEVDRVIDTPHGQSRGILDSTPIASKGDLMPGPQRFKRVPRGEGAPFPSLKE